MMTTGLMIVIPVFHSHCGQAKLRHLTMVTVLPQLSITIPAFGQQAAICTSRPVLITQCRLVNVTTVG